MKKALSLLIAIVLAVVCLVSCNIIPKHEHISDEHWSFNEHQHWKNIRCNWLCHINIVSYDHIDDNGDLRCDVCGYNFGHQGHEFYYVSNYDGHCEHMVGESCDGNCQKSPHEGWYADLVCDICGYEMELRVVNDILRNQAGAEWLNDVSAENIAEIKIISEAVGVAPGTFKDISTTTDEAVIERVFEDIFLSEVIAIPKSEGEVDGGGAITIKFIFKGGQVKELHLNNGNYHDTNGNYFELLNVPRFNEEDNSTKSYGFITYRGYGELYDAGGGAICSFWMYELEFIKVTDDIVLDTKPITHYVETEFGKIYFLSDEYFYIEGIVEGDPWVGTKPQYFQLVGKNLEELIYDYTVLPD